jgi:two-component system, cell cycle sensor histidine kinase and response regulator CckA
LQITANDRDETLHIQQMKGDSVSLIIMDLIIPIMDDRQCLAGVLQIDPNARVVFASGYSEGGPVNGVVAAGTKGFIQKPYNLEQLLTTVHEVMDGA